MKLNSVSIILSLLSGSSAFLSTGRPAFCSSRHLVEQNAVSAVFDEDEVDEIVPIVKNFLSAKYKSVIASHGHEICDKEDAKDILRSILPPVTPAELDDEVSKTLSLFPGDKISEADFVTAIMQNSYWQEAGGLVVKELIYFDALYSYYHDKVSLLNSEDWEDLKENLSWEGSSVATMKANEALFITAVAGSKRGQPIMDDDEYAKLKTELVKEDSWVTARGQDALEKLGIDSFLGYLHRVL